MTQYEKAADRVKICDIPNQTCVSITHPMHLARDERVDGRLRLNVRLAISRHCYEACLQTTTTVLAKNEKDRHMILFIYS